MARTAQETNTKIEVFLWEKSETQKSSSWIICYRYIIFIIQGVLIIMSVRYSEFICWDFVMFCSCFYYRFTFGSVEMLDERWQKDISIGTIMWDPILTIIIYHWWKRVFIRLFFEQSVTKKVDQYNASNALSAVSSFSGKSGKKAITKAYSTLSSSLSVIAMFTPPYREKNPIFLLNHY